MSIRQFFVMLVLVAMFGYGIHLRLNDSNTEEGGLMSEVASEIWQGSSFSSFIKVPPINGVKRNTVLIVGPTCGSDAGQRTRQLAGEIKSHNIPYTISSQLSVNTTSGDEALYKNFRRVIKGNPPVVFINGKAKANPSIKDVLAEYRKSKG